MGVVADVTTDLITAGGGSRKKIFGGEGLAPHHLGGNNEQNCCVQLKLKGGR